MKGEKNYQKEEKEIEKRLKKKKTSQKKEATKDRKWPGETISRQYTMIGGSVFSCLDRGFLLPPVCLFRSLLHTSQRGVGVQEGNGQGYCNWIKFGSKDYILFFLCRSGKEGLLGIKL